LDTVFCLEDAIDTRIAILVSLDYTRKEASGDPVVLNLLNRLSFLKPLPDNSGNDELPSTEVSDIGVFNANVSSSPPARESSSPPSPVIEAPQLAETRECETAAEQAWLQEVFSNLNIDNTSTETSPPEDLEFFDCDISPSINDELEFFFRVISSIVSPISARWYYSAAELNSHHSQLIDKGNFAPCLSACDTDTATTASDHLGVTDEQSYHVVIYDATGHILKDVQVSWKFSISLSFTVKHRTESMLFATRVLS